VLDEFYFEKGIYLQRRYLVCFNRHLHRLGFDLPGDPFCRRDHAPIPDCWFSIPDRGWRALYLPQAAPLRLEWRSAAIVGLFLLVGGNGGVMWAEQRVASGIAALLIGSVPLWIALLDSLRPGGRRPDRWVIVGVLAGFAGILILIGPAQLIGIQGEVDLVGAVVLLLAALSWAAGSLFNRGAKLPDSPLLGTGMEMLVGSLGLFILGTVTGEWSQMDLTSFSTRSLLGFAYLVVFGSLVGFASYVWLLRVAPTMLVSTYAYVNPLIAILLGSLLAGESLTPRIVLAVMFILGSVVLITLTNPATSKSAAAENAPIASGND
jgi:drug/metabolite transporter (DMT)-like permease